MLRTPLFTYESAKGFSLRRNCMTMSPPELEPPDRDIFPRLGAFTYKSSEPVLFFPWEEGISASPSLLSSEEGVPISPDEVPGIPLEWGPPWAFLLSSLSSFADT